MLCSTIGLSSDKQSTLAYCSGKVVVMSIAKGVAMLREVFFDGKILHVKAWNSSFDDYEFPVSEDVYKCMPDKSKAVYHNGETFTNSIEIFGIAKKSVFDL